MGDGKAESRSAHLRVSGLVHAVELLEQIGQMLFFNADAIVLHDDASLAQQNFHMTAPAAVAYGVAHQVMKNLPQVLFHGP